MDLASAPRLADTPPAPWAAQTGCVRRLSAAEAADPTFLAAWEALVDEAAEPNPFLEPWFMRPSLELFGNAKTELLACYDGDRLIGLIPLARRSLYYGYPLPHYAGWLHDNAFCGGPLVLRGYEHAFWSHLFADLDQAPGMALFLHLPELLAEGPLATALTQVIASSARQAVIVEDGERAMLASDLSPDAYFEASMSAKKRKELRRQHKRLGEVGEITFSRSEDADGAEDWIERFLSLESSGWKGDAGSALASAATTRDFCHAALNGASRAGKLERLTLSLDGQPIAMLANFITPPGAFSFKTAYDERYARFSPGLLLQIENLQLLDREGIEWADSCAEPGHSMIERIWREKRRFVSLNIAIGGPVRRSAFRALMAYETRGSATR